MTLAPKPPLSAVLAKVPLPATLRASLIAHAKAARVGESEAVRQWLAAYLVRPSPLAPCLTGPLVERFPLIRSSQDLVDAVRSEALRQCVSVAELIRRVVATHAV